MKSCCAALCILAIVALASCKSHEQTSQASPHPSNPTSTPAPEKSLTTEANARAMNDFAAHWRPCPQASGEMWYGKYTDAGKTYICQVKHPVPRAEPRELTEADKLNGILWQGEIKFFSDAYRMYDPEKKAWTDWQDPGGNGFWEMWMSDKHGQWGVWHVGSAGLMMRTDGVGHELSTSGDDVNKWNPIECSEIPSG